MRIAVQLAHPDGRRDWYLMPPGTSTAKAMLWAIQKHRLPQSIFIVPLTELDELTSAQ